MGLHARRLRGTGVVRYVAPIRGLLHGVGPGGLWGRALPAPKRLVLALRRTPGPGRTSGPGLPRATLRARAPQASLLFCQELLDQQLAAVHYVVEHDRSVVELLLHLLPHGGWRQPQHVVVEALQSSVTSETCRGKGGGERVCVCVRV